MSEVIIFRNTDGTCGVIIPAPDVLVEYVETVKFDQVYDEIDQLGNITQRSRVVEEFHLATRPISIEEIAKKDVPEGLPWFVIEDGKLPLDSEGQKLFRDAWTCDPEKKTIFVDMEKARDIQLSDIKIAREEKFIELGFPTKLDPDLEEVIIPQKTQNKLIELRDVTEDINLLKAKTPEELKNIWPEILN